MLAARQNARVIVYRIPKCHKNPKPISTQTMTHLVDECLLRRFLVNSPISSIKKTKIISSSDLRQSCRGLVHAFLLRSYYFVFRDSVRQHRGTSISRARGLCSSRLCAHLSLARLVHYLREHPDAQNHNQETDRYDDQQGEAEPTHDHRAGPHARHDTPVAEILGDDTRGHGCRMLP